MPNEWVAAAIIAGVVLSLALARTLTGGTVAPVVFNNEREERLTRKLSAMLGCSLGAALPSMRQELELAPSQSDETLLKRAAYHYRQSIPDGQCRVWRDRTPG